MYLFEAFSIPVAKEMVYDLKTWIDIVAESKNKKTFIATKEWLDNIERGRYRSGKSSVNFLNHNFDGTLITFPFAPFDPYFKEFDQIIQWKFESAIFSGIVHIKNVLHNDEVPPLVLTLNDLGIGFLVCTFPLALSLVVFLTEVTVLKIKLIAKNIRDALVAVYVIGFSVKILF